MNTFRLFNPQLLTRHTQYMMSGLVSLILVSFILTGCQLYPEMDSPDAFKIVGEILEFERTPSTMRSVSESESMDSEDMADPEINVVVTSDVEAADGTKSTNVLAQGTFKDGQLHLGIKKKELSFPTLATIAVSVGESEPIKKQTWIAKDRHVEFVLADYFGVGYELAFKGSQSRSTDVAKKFSLSGNLNDQDVLNPDTTNVQITGTTYLTDGTKRTVELGSVLVHDGKFLIETDIDHIAFVEVKLRDGNKFRVSPMIAQPGIDFELFPARSFGEFGIKAQQDGAHAKLIDAWLWDEEFLDLMEEARAARAIYKGETQQARVEELVDLSSRSGDHDSLPEADAGPGFDFAKHFPAVDECQHVDLNEVIWSAVPEPNTDDLPDFAKKMEYALNFAREVVTEVIENSDDPWLIWAALQLDAFPPTDEWIKTTMQAYQRISSSFSKEFLELNIDPIIKQHTNQKLVEENDAKLVPGQIAPSFKLVNLDGEEISLANVLQISDRILIDFWASWCGPCIASFPKLKEMYASYEDKGFSIIGVSIDETDEAWKEKSEELALPWINLGENQGFTGPTPLMFGVQFIPKTYLLDRKGCIVQKDIKTSQLETMLSKRYGELE